MKLTQSKTVRDIVRPPVTGMPEHPSVAISGLIVHAVELMLENDVSEIAVVGHDRLIGHIRLSDALEHLGLRMSGNPPAGEVQE
jgi:predicted transcriptional regulator